MSKFSSILVANRGEIACRILRTAKELGYRTVAVYSEADAQALHVRMADEAVYIGAGPVNESYLVQEKILAAAKASEAGAIHPGYGFLSENAEFAKSCVAEGITFIGPSADAIRLMGNKAEAKRLMIEAGVPCIPGYQGADQSDESLLSEGRKIGVPVMVKAAAGGGGRGMRLVSKLEDLESAIHLARAEARSAFGSGELILEKAIIQPRHVEVQVFADNHGSTIYLGERDCSIQRRHQKVVEEAPCPVMTSELRVEMGEAAVAAASYIDYCGAGTIEFLLDSSGDFYFLEMNTRLQVEHPVTELITGLDLVALQIQVAQGEPLGIDQENVTIDGHAIEVRLYTEDPSQDFLPTSGLIDLWRSPEGKGIRVDHGIDTGDEISPYYDPMVAKVIAHGPTRDVARLRLIDALKQIILFGPKHNRDFLVACLENKCFAMGSATTAFIAEQFDEANLTTRAPSFLDASIAAVIELVLEYENCSNSAVLVAPQLRNWSSAGELTSRKQYIFGETTHDLYVTGIGHNLYRIMNKTTSCEVELLKISDGLAVLKLNGMQYSASFCYPGSGKLYVSVDGLTSVYCDQVRLDGVKCNDTRGGNIVAPMHGLLQEVRVNTGDAVETGQTVAVLEAMKMHYEIVCEASGMVGEIMVEAGTQVAADDVLIVIEVGEVG